MPALSTIIDLINVTIILKIQDFENLYEKHADLAVKQPVNRCSLPCCHFYNWGMDFIHICSPLSTLSL